ncbi:MAG: NADH-quinone oxidoreductase subunit A [Planctomycetes bacterium]|nr:NADH-quinone oxidoreductase subunit A [Planctomycetota bacterium]
MADPRPPVPQNLLAPQLLTTVATSGGAILVDTAQEILGNKLGALLHRAELRDVIDTAPCSRRAWIRCGHRSRGERSHGARAVLPGTVGAHHFDQPAVTRPRVGCGGNSVATTFDAAAAAFAEDERTLHVGNGGRRRAEAAPASPAADRLALFIRRPAGTMFGHVSPTLDDRVPVATFPFADPAPAYGAWASVAVVGALAFVIVGGALLTVRIVTRVLDRIQPTTRRLSTYECGEEPIGSAWFRFNNRFTTIALVFLVFDAELALLWPILPRCVEWLGQGRGALVFLEVTAFVGTLAIGFAWVAAKGGFLWDRTVPARPDRPEVFRG